MTSQHHDTKPVSVRAPADAIAWAASYGWVTDTIDLADVLRRGDLVVIVTDGQVREMPDPTKAPDLLATIVRVDRELHELRVRFGRLLSDLVGAGDASERP